MHMHDMIWFDLPTFPSWSYHARNRYASSRSGSNCNAEPNEAVIEWPENSEILAFLIAIIRSNALAHCTTCAPHTVNSIYWPKPIDQLINDQNRYNIIWHTEQFESSASTSVRFINSFCDRFAMMVVASPTFVHTPMTSTFSSALRSASILIFLNS